MLCSLPDEAALELNCSWLVCLFQRGFAHPNPQVHFANECDTHEHLVMSSCQNVTHRTYSTHRQIKFSAPCCLSHQQTGCLSYSCKADQQPAITACACYLAVSHPVSRLVTLAAEHYVSLQVQMHILQSLLELPWPPHTISALPQAFVVQDVLDMFCTGMMPICSYMRGDVTLGRAQALSLKALAYLPKAALLSRLKVVCV